MGFLKLLLAKITGAGRNVLLRLFSFFRLDEVISFVVLNVETCIFVLELQQRGFT